MVVGSVARGGGVLPDKSDGGARRALRSLNLWIGTA